MPQDRPDQTIEGQKAMQSKHNSAPTKPAFVEIAGRAMGKARSGRLGNSEALADFRGQPADTCLAAGIPREAVGAVRHNGIRNSIAELRLLGRERTAAIDETKERQRKTDDHTQKIREKAFELWTLEGCLQGRELNDWDSATRLSSQG